MTCHDREQDLLLLLHGELSPGRRLRLLAHLRRCSRCRQQQEKLLGVSQLIAGAVRTPNMPPWVVVRNRRSLPRLRRPYALMFLLLTLLTGWLFYTTSGRQVLHIVTPAAQKAGSVPSDHCK